MRDLFPTKQGERAIKTMKESHGLGHWGFHVLFHVHDAGVGLSVDELMDECQTPTERASMRRAINLLKKRSLIREEE